MEFKHILLHSFDFEIKYDNVAFLFLLWKKYYDTETVSYTNDRTNSSLSMHS